LRLLFQPFLRFYAIVLNSLYGDIWPLMGFNPS